MTTVPQDFLDIDPNEDHWLIHNEHWVPALETPNGKRLSDMTDAMMGEIPGQDDVVTPLELHDQRFYKFAMAFLMQDGDLAVPGGRYGISTSSCAEVAIVCSLIMQYHNGEPVSYYSLNSDMGSVVNSSDDVYDMIRENAALIGLNAEDYIDDDINEDEE